MAHIVADRVLEFSSSTGAGNLGVSGAVTGYRTFASVLATNDTFTYYIEEVSESGLPTGAFETGVGTWLGSNTFSRTEIHSSSNANAPVVWGVGTRRVSLSLLAKAYVADLKVTGKFGYDAGILTYENRADLRAGSPVNNTQAVVKGLGIFMFVAGSIQVDDDETAFAATGGVWEMIGTDPDYNYAVHSDFSNNLALRTTDLESAKTELANDALFGSFTMSTTSLAANTTVTFNCTVTGATTNDFPVVSPGNSVGGTEHRVSFFVYMSAANTATVVLRNHTAAAATLVASTWRVMVVKNRAVVPYTFA